VLKVTVIGGGSTYTPELLNGFIERQDVFPLDELWLMDIDPQRLEIVGHFAQQMAKAQDASFKVILSTDQKEAISGASYVITQLRVGQMAARREDEYLGRRHGLVGQETTGVGGMAKALRTIPVVMNIAHDIEAYAPGALLVNFANPSGLVTEALFRYAPEISAVGVCNVAITTKMTFLEKLEELNGMKVDPQTAQLKGLGLNHLSWFYGFEVGGQELWPQIMAAIIAEAETSEDLHFDPATLRSLQMLPNYYLRYYYYTEEVLAEQQAWPPSRAEEVMEIEAGLLAQYGEKDRIKPPEELMKRGGAYYSTVATQLLNAHYNDLNEIHIVNVRHNGAVQGWDPDWVLEMPCQINAHGITPIPTEPLPPVCSGLIADVKSYEILTAEAAATGDRNAAYQALLAHPLGPSADQVSTVLEDMLDTNRPYLPAFFD
jgi:6-phospho-beta-glucosidase